MSILIAILAYHKENDKQWMSIREGAMFINKSSAGKNNLCGEKIARLRMEMGISQRILADKLQIAGLDIDKNADRKSVV